MEGREIEPGTFTHLVFASPSGQPARVRKWPERGLLRPPPISQYHRIGNDRAFQGAFLQRPLPRPRYHTHQNECSGKLARGWDKFDGRMGRTRYLWDCVVEEVSTRSLHASLDLPRPESTPGRYVTVGPHHPPYRNPSAPWAELGHPVRSSAAGSSAPPPPPPPPLPHSLIRAPSPVHDGNLGVLNYSNNVNIGNLDVNVVRAHRARNETNRYNRPPPDLPRRRSSSLSSQDICIVILINIIVAAVILNLVKSLWMSYA